MSHRTWRQRGISLFTTLILLFACLSGLTAPTASAASGHPAVCSKWKGSDGRAYAECTSGSVYFQVGFACHYPIGYGFEVRGNWAYPRAGNRSIASCPLTHGRILNIPGLMSVKTLPQSALLMYYTNMGKALIKSKSKDITKHIWAITIVIGLVLIAGIIYIQNSFVAFRNDQLLQEHFRRYDYSMLVFCYNHDIKPCDNNAIWNWNADHPADKFDYKSAQQLSNEVQLSNF